MRAPEIHPCEAERLITVQARRTLLHPAPESPGAADTERVFRWLNRLPALPRLLCCVRQWHFSQICIFPVSRASAALGMARGQCPLGVSELPHIHPQCHLLWEPRVPLGYWGLKQEHPLCWAALGSSVSQPVQTNPPVPFCGRDQRSEGGSGHRKSCYPGASRAKRLFSTHGISCVTEMSVLLNN